MQIKNKDIEKMIRYRNRFNKMAEIELNNAKRDYEMMDSDFIFELQQANKYAGAASAIDYMLNEIGCSEKSLKQREIVKNGFIQRGIGLSVCTTGILFLTVFGGFVGAVGCIICVPVGVDLVFTRKQKIFVNKQARIGKIC